MVNTRIYSPVVKDWQPRYELYSLHQVRVVESFFGDIKVGDIVNVGQVGGEKDRIRVVSEYFIPFEKGDDLVLFLVWYGYEEITHAELTVPWAAVYRYVSQENTLSTERLNDDNRILGNMHEKNEIKLTIGELLNYRAVE
jgi:hypothetical protein